ncbi:RNA-binding protein [Patescibacteria group bacterium]|nr:RNA-binding protein [Patescibacteria group bacterium]MBU4098935.1 RNA-binding protein [Patescibacteria group bacterium]
MAKKLFVGGISWDTTESSLKDFFAKAGTVISATIIIDRYTGKSKGFGFVEMSTDEEAEKAKNELNGQSLDGRSIVINEARPQQPRENNYSGGNGGGKNYGGGNDKRRDYRDDRRGRDRRGGGGY